MSGYPDGCTQAMHDSYYRDVPRSVLQRADELAGEDWDNQSEAAGEWLQNIAMHIDEEIVGAFVRACVRARANPFDSDGERKVYEAARVLRNTYISYAAERFESAAAKEEGYEL